MENRTKESVGRGALRRSSELLDLTARGPAPGTPATPRVPVLG